MSGQIISQLWGVCITLIWSAVVAAAALFVVRMFVGLRVPEDEEREGLDTTSHGETAYNM
jgi:Amt family ammonium transporter